jgi:hypothetical protein
MECGSSRGLARSRNRYGSKRQQSLAADCRLEIGETLTSILTHSHVHELAPKKIVAATREILRHVAQDANYIVH